MVKASMFSAADASRLTALAQNSQQETEVEGDDALGAPAAQVYASKSGGIMTTLESILEKAEEQLEDSRKTETDSLHHFQALKQSLEYELKFGRDDLDKVKRQKAANLESKAVSEGDLGVTTQDLDTDTKSLADLHQQCQVKAQEYEEETKSR